jgi:hypothetical protein
MSLYAGFVFFLKYFHANKHREAKFYLAIYLIEIVAAMIMCLRYIIKMYMLEI